ncbi:hypothetical protein [Motilibacter aurantiacus]|uniref:hypothetical protein n=1 Tax=Motilibacter aurantiacus TaxID=2714955 RepID=UPI001409A5D6|nr:hypothetical protein [Motilibacter aurantiacus]NHC44576.1 hypothetical protein [Motilibacter aurantiacus]
MRARTPVAAALGAAVALVTLVAAAPGSLGGAVARAAVEPPVAIALDVSRPVHVFTRATPVTETLVLRFSTPVDGSVTGTLRPPRGRGAPVKFALADEYGLAWRASLVLQPAGPLGTWELADVRYTYTDDRGVPTTDVVPDTSAFSLRQASTVTARVDRPRVSSGRSVTVHARAAGLDGRPLAGAPLVLEGRTGSGPWKRLGAYRAAADGRVTAQQRATGPLRLRWRMPGTETAAASVSAAVLVTVT